MDALINVLNQRVSNQIAQTQTPAAATPGKQSFADVLDTKRSESAIDKITSKLRDGDGDIKVIAADDIKINMANVETGETSGFSPKQKVMDMFSGLNGDMNNLESAIEVLSDPNVKLSRRQLLAYQAGIGQFSFMAETVAKGTQAALTSIQTILNTNIG